MKKLCIRPFNAKTKDLQETIDEYIWGYDDDTFESVIGRLLQNREATVSTAESCTGGSIAKMIVSVPGSSAYFTGSVVAYDNSVKQSLLGVEQYSLDHFGAVSQPVVEQMALGGLKLLGTDYCIATTGIAGPTGGSDEKPVGTTWIAVASRQDVVSKLLTLGDNRERNILRASVAALNLLREVLLAE